MHDVDFLYLRIMDPMRSVVFDQLDLQWRIENISLNVDIAMSDFKRDVHCIAPLTFKHNLSVKLFFKILVLAEVESFHS